MELTEKDKARFWAKVRKSDGCWEWNAGLSKGYGEFKKSNKWLQAHRVSWHLVHGQIPSGLFVCHHCDNKSCVNLSHLFLGTPLDNMRDSQIKGRQGWKYGEQCHLSKINESQARIIKREWRSGINTTELATRFNISKSQVRQIGNGTAWSWLSLLESEAQHE